MSPRAYLLADNHTPAAHTHTSAPRPQTRGRDTSPPTHGGVSLRQPLLSPGGAKTFIIMTPRRTHACTRIERKRHKTTPQPATRDDDSITSYITHTVRVSRLNNNIMNKNSHNRNDGGLLLLLLMHFSSVLRVCVCVCVSPSQ